METEAGGNRLRWSSHKILISYEGKVETVRKRNEVIEADMSSGEG